MSIDAAQEVPKTRSSETQPAIVITGAASGIGREIARMAAMDGSFLLLVDRSCQQLGDFVAELAGNGV